MFYFTLLCLVSDIKENNCLQLTNLHDVQYAQSITMNYQVTVLVVDEPYRKLFSPLNSS